MESSISVKNGTKGWSGDGRWDIDGGGRMSWDLVVEEGPPLAVMSRGSAEGRSVGSGRGDGVSRGCGVGIRELYLVLEAW